MTFEDNLRVTRRRLLRAAAALSAVALLAVPFADHARADSKAPSLGVPGVKGGVVTTSEPVAAEAGAEILRRGGNAIDAAAAVQFALTVAEPQSSGIGGGFFMLVYLAKSGKTVILDAREKTPAAGDPDMFLLASDPTKAFSFGVRSTSGIGVGVPGTVSGFDLALKKWGTMSLDEVLAPAIDLAENGFRVSSRLAESVTSSRLQSEPGNPAYEEARSVFLPGGEALEEGDLLVQENLANTLKELAEKGAGAFYSGPIAQGIVDTQKNTRTVADPDDQAKLVGRMTLADLANYAPAIREPVTGEYRGFKIVSMPPPSSGGLTVIQMLKLMERFPLGDESAGYGFGRTRTLNVMLESMRLAFADRALWMGDDDFVDVPSDGLLDDGYIATRTVLIDPDARQANVEAGDPRPFDNAGLVPEVKFAAGPQNPQEGVNTTHFSISDRFGNLVSVTSTIESAWGTGLMVPGRGFLLNNELTDFNRFPAANPDPNNFNPGANDAAANKRPRSSMAPTMVFHGKRPLAAYGSPGGSSIINTVLNITLDLIDHDRTIQEAIELPRISLNNPSTTATTLVEFGFPDESLDGLRALGHNLFVGFELGSVQSVVIDKKSRLQYGAADERRIGTVISVRKDEIDADDREDDDEDDD